MQNWNRFSGVLGAVLLFFGLIGGVLVNSFSVPLILSHLIAGLALLLLWLVTSGGQLGNMTSTVFGRSGRFAGNVVLYTTVFVGILVALNYAVSKNDKRWDLTEQGVYSLSPQSRSTVQALKRPLKIVGVADTGSADDTQLLELLELYAYYNKDKVKTEVVSARTKPQLLDTYGMKPGNVIYLEYGEGEKKGVSRLNETTEEAITNAIVKLTRGDAKKIYFVQGHDELELEGAGPQGLKELHDAIGDEHLSVQGIVLSQVGSIPQDAAAVMLVAPKKPLLPEERELLVKYVEGGGRLLMMTDPRSPGDVRELAAKFGISVGDNVVIDQIQRLFAGPTLGAQPIIVDYADHPIAKDFNRQTISIFNIASTVTASGKNDAAVTYTELLKSSETAWGETNLSGVFDSEDPTAILEESDVQGPVSLGVVYEKKLDEPKAAEGESSDAEFQRVARVVVFGDSDWVMNQNLNVYSNRDLILNSINWVVGEEGGVTIRPKSIRASYAPIPLQTFLYLLASSFVIPELILILGLFIWWRRKAAVA